MRFAIGTYSYLVRNRNRQLFIGFDSYAFLRTYLVSFNLLGTSVDGS